MQAPEAASGATDAVMTEVISPATTTATTSPTRVSLQEKLKAFTEFPQFWEEDVGDMDPRLKEEQDREVEAFRLRLEAMDSRRRSDAPPSKMQFNDGSIYDAITKLCVREMTAKKDRTRSTPAAKNGTHSTNSKKENSATSTPNLPGTNSNNKNTTDRKSVGNAAEPAQQPKRNDSNNNTSSKQPNGKTQPTTATANQRKQQATAPAATTTTMRSGGAASVTSATNSKSNSGRVHQPALVSNNNYVL